MSEADLAESQKRNPPQRFNRLWRGVWSSGEGDGLNPADIAACTTLEGPAAATRGPHLLAGLDLGINRDHSAFCILAADPTQRHGGAGGALSWNPGRLWRQGGPDRDSLRRRTAYQLYQFIGCKYDFWQAEYMAQELTAAGVPMSETKMPRGGL